MAEQNPPEIKSEPIDTYGDSFGSTGCVKIETIHGFEIKCEVDEEDQIVQECKLENEQIDGVIKYDNIEENTTAAEPSSKEALRNDQGSNSKPQKNPVFTQQTYEIIEKLKKCSQIVIKNKKSSSDSHSSSSNTPQNRQIVIKNPKPSAETIIIKQNSQTLAENNIKVLQNSIIKAKVSDLIRSSKIVQSLGKRSQDLANSLRSRHPMSKSTESPTTSFQKLTPPTSSPQKLTNVTIMPQKPPQTNMVKIVQGTIKGINSSKNPQTIFKFPKGAIKTYEMSIKIPKQIESDTPATTASKIPASSVQKVASNLETVAKTQLEQEIKAKRFRSCTSYIHNYRIKENPETPEIKIEKDIEEDQNSFDPNAPQCTVTSPENSTTITGSTSQEATMEQFKIKEEPDEDAKFLIMPVQIKEEPALDIPCSDYESSEFTISEINEHDSNFDPSKEDHPSDDIFQYNVVNSFKSDLATRRSVLHTVVSEGSHKPAEEIAELALKELLKLEAEKEEEEMAISTTKEVAVPLNVNGIRVVTKIAMPNVKKTADSTNYQCPVCLIKFKVQAQLIAHKRIHDVGKAKLNTAEMTKNVYEEVKMRIEQIGSRRSFHVLLPKYDYAFVVTNSTAAKLYMKCFRQTCDVKAYSTNDGKFFLKVGDKHNHGPDTSIIMNKISEAKLSMLEKSNVFNKQVHEAIIQKQKQKDILELKKDLLLERIKKSSKVEEQEKLIEMKRNSLIERIKRTQQSVNEKEGTVVVKKQRLS